jgi:rhomboid protease GluP
VQHGNGVPKTVTTSNLVTGVFLAVMNLGLGFIPGVDNMAHLGGLIAGLVAGYGLARPLNPLPRSFSDRHLTVSTVCLGALVALLALPVQDAIENSENESRVQPELVAFRKTDEAALAAVTDIFQAAKARTLDRSAQADRLQQEVVKLYEESYKRLSAIALRKESPRFALKRRMERVADLRRLGFRMMADAVRAKDAAAFKKAEEILKEANGIVRARPSPAK